jgi:hypothetical protein
MLTDKECIDVLRHAAEELKDILSVVKRAGGLAAVNSLTYGIYCYGEGAKGEESFEQDIANIDEALRKTIMTRRPGSLNDLI